MASRRLPTEEDQYLLYKKVAEEASGRPVIIRTFDIGGDKPVPAISLPQEPNPFLGYRGIRIYQENYELFRHQVRAILRAAVFGQLKIHDFPWFQPGSKKCAGLKKK